MASIADSRAYVHWASIPAWLPLVTMPVMVIVIGSEWPGWVLMWSLALTIYAGLKWLTFVDFIESGNASAWRSLAYLLLWPGMNAKAFLSDSKSAGHPAASDWLWAIMKLLLGVFLVNVAISIVDQDAWLAGWMGMAGIAFTLHFGLFHLLAVFWRRARIDVQPIMNAPILASSLSDFWGRRWNLAFRDLAHAYVFRPLVGRLGVAAATMVVFLVSGVVHDLVISVGVGAGYGLPTLYFVIQGVGVLVERSRIGRAIGFGSPVTGRLYCAMIVLAPLGLLFHRQFVERIVVPMLAVFGAT